MMALVLSKPGLHLRGGKGAASEPRHTSFDEIIVNSSRETRRPERGGRWKNWPGGWMTTQESPGKVHEYDKIIFLWILFVIMSLNSNFSVIGNFIMSHPHVHADCKTSTRKLVSNFALEQLKDQARVMTTFWYLRRSFHELGKDGWVSWGKRLECPCGVLPISSWKTMLEPILRIEIPGASWRYWNYPLTSVLVYGRRNFRMMINGALVEEEIPFEKTIIPQVPVDGVYGWRNPATQF